MATQKSMRKVLVLTPPDSYKIYEQHYLQKFDIINASKSPLPLPQFLTHHARSLTALLCNAGTNISADLLRLLPALRCIVTTSAGVNHIDLAECRRRGIAVANAPGIFSDDVADTAVALVIDVMRRISAGDRFLRTSSWFTVPAFPLGSKLGGKRVGIVGLGSIGLKVAMRLEAFGCVIAYNSRKKKPSISYPFYDDVCQLATDCDIVVVCCALTNETRNMINKEVLLALGKEGVIVNVARGAIIDEKELVRCLVEGEIGGAGLDVFANEPDVPSDLFELENVVLSPHRAVYTEESFWATYELMSGNLEAFFSNKPLLSPVISE